MEILSKEFAIGNLRLEISVHDLSYRMGLAPDEIHQNHLYVNVTAKDKSGRRLWVTPILSKDGKVKAYSSVNEALNDAKQKISLTAEIQHT
ncbi:MAG TPA: hypothetical protein VD884_04075 [Ohtaekwangia sp.]|nr:hypothetical protein [Ohtaekwangia sp.]